MSESSSTETADSLQSVTRGASLFFVGRILGNGLKFVLNAILTRGLGSGLFGVYAFAKTLISVFVVLSRAGTGKSILRYVPATEDDPERRNAVVGLAYLTVLVGSALIGVALYVIAPTISSLTLENPLLVDVLRIFAILLPFKSVMQLTNAVFRSIEKLELQVAVSDIAEPVTNIVVVSIALFLGYSLIGAVAALAIGAVLVCSVALSLVYVKTDIRPDIITNRSSRETFEFYNYSIPLTLKDLGSILYTRVDILMVGFFLVESAVGIYQIAILVSSLLILPLQGFNQLFPPIASRLYTNNEFEELESMFRIVTRWTLTVAIPMALVTMVYPTELLRIFGPDFPAGGTVLILFTLAQLTNCAVGPSGFLLMMTDHQYLNMANQWTLGVMNIGLNYLLILEFGFIGAAVATASTLAFINVIRVIEVWHLEGFSPYSSKFWKPIAAGLASGAVMLGVERFLEGYPLLVAGTFGGGIVFVLLLIVFGIEQDDREFFEEVVRPKLT